MPMYAMNRALTLSYTRPAADWAEALPVGNGRLGAMVRGGLPVERIHLNEDTFWSGPGDTAVPRVPAGLLESVREHIRAGRHVDAGRELGHPGRGRGGVPACRRAGAGIRRISGGRGNVSPLPGPARRGRAGGTDRRRTPSAAGGCSPPPGTR
ncbi:hypothetical protein CEB94_04535 [Streptomyces hawaiiensis]|uniref:Glycosyl hydrolase family 95 N-terminal domain-containing protein n=1 Tax=Streptomyces hawaiiensis TaxID=67305 RepID=A0A6G5R828_9ACTN|nr:hypothetical protein CEB94_04535 [Streptomyces hawaiiensis]